MNISQGTVNSAFVVHGTGFAPRTPVTVTLTELSPPPPTQIVDSTSSVKPVTSGNGTLSFKVGQLFPGSLQLGLCTVEVTGSGGRKASTQFQVIP
jgi:hypothetical protein